MANLGIWVRSLSNAGFLELPFQDKPGIRVCGAPVRRSGRGAGYTQGWTNITSLALTRLTESGKVSALVPLILGLVLYTRFLGANLKWLNRIPTAFMVGVGTGLAFPRFAQSDLVGQIRGTMVDLRSINNVIVVMGALATLSYFFYTSENKGVTALTKLW